VPIRHRVNARVLTVRPRGGERNRENAEIAIAKRNSELAIVHFAVDVRRFAMQFVQLNLFQNRDFR
jgi:hypothetical protein